MRMGDLELRHIVDVDGQLIGIDADVVDAGTLLRRTHRSADRRVFLIRAGERIAIGTHQHIRLDEDEVVFFETMPAPAAQAPSSRRAPTRLAA